MSRRPAARSGMAWPALLAVLVVACRTEAAWRLNEPPWTVETIGEHEDARATLADGTQVVLGNARVVPNPWSPYLAGDSDDRRRRIELAEIVRLETRRRPPERFSEYGEATQLVLIVLALVLAGLIWNEADAH